MLRPTTLERVPTLTLFENVWLYSPKTSAACGRAVEKIITHERRSHIQLHVSPECLTNGCIAVMMIVNDITEVRTYVGLSLFI
jgi:hypothetical protein